MTDEQLADLRARIAKGPWSVSLADDTIVIGPDGSEIAAIDGDYNDPDLWPIMEANAELIAMAPDLLDEVVRLRALICPSCLGTRWVCENHPNQVAHKCAQCRGAGMPCLACNPSSRDGEFYRLREAMKAIELRAFRQLDIGENHAAGLMGASDRACLADIRDRARAVLGGAHE